MSAYGITRKWAFLRLTFVLVIGGLGHDQASAAKINRDVPKATPSIDGTITAEEMSSQLAIAMVWPVTNGALVLDGSGHGVDDISATWYVSWNEQNLNISAVVRDDTPDFRISSGGIGNVPYNGQDVIQAVFNPNNDQSNEFVDPNGEPGTAAIYDMVVDTEDEFGPDVYRHGPQLTTDQRASIAIDGQITATGYILEAAIPWTVALDNATEVVAEGDQHGLAFLLLGFNGTQGDTADIATLISDFGDGANTIGDPTTWHTITLTGGSLLGDVNLDGLVNGLDVDPFVDVLLSGPYQAEADMNNDQVVNGLDVDPFVAAVVGGGAQQIPEPATLLLALVALGVVRGWRKWGG
jgi:hypothetical protein